MLNRCSKPVKRLCTSSYYFLSIFICQLKIISIRIIYILAEISEDYGGNILCTITVEDSDFYYEPENYQYFLCFEEGAIVSDTVITLPLQIRI